MGEAPITVGRAVRCFVESHRVLVRHGIADIVGDYGEKIAEQTIGGRRMPPTCKDYDLIHSHYGNVQIKTRALLDRVNGARSNETRAVLGRNRCFDWLFHIILNRDMLVCNAILLPVSGVSDFADRNSGKISILQSQSVLGAIDLSVEARMAQVKLDEML